MTRLRLLASRVQPLEGEALDSWVEATATHFQATIAETVRALGFTSTQGENIARLRGRAGVIRLADTEARRVGHVSGMRTERVQQMTMVGVGPHAVTFTAQGRIRSSSQAARAHGGYCSDCLRETGGRWQLLWRFRFGLACPAHRRLLVETCPTCGRDPRDVSYRTARIPEPNRCAGPLVNRNPSAGRPRHRCRADLTAHEIPAIPADDQVMGAQDIIGDLVKGRVAAFGLYAHAPQTPETALEDICGLAHLAKRALERATTTAQQRQLAAPALLGNHLAELLQDELARPGGAETHRVPLRNAASITLAVAALTATDAATDLTRHLVQGSTVRNTYSPQLRRIITTSRGIHQRPTLFLKTSRISASSPCRADKLPARLWDEWMSRVPDLGIDREIVATAIPVAAVLTGTRLTHSAARTLLGLPAASRQVSYVMRTLSSSVHEDVILSMIIRLAGYLDANPTPIDYGRRRGLNCDELLTRDQWKNLCDRLNLNPGADRSWKLANSYVRRLLTGDASISSSRSQQHPLSGSREEAFILGLPDALRTALHHAGADFLRQCNINEPLTWPPPISICGLDADAAIPKTTAGEIRGWSAVRPVRGRLDPARMVDRYRGGASTYELASLEAVSRQSIARTLAAEGVQGRVGAPERHPIDTDWLRRHYLEEKLTITQIAEQIGCSPATVSHRLRAAGIAVRPRGSGSGRAHLHPAEVAGGSPLLRRVLIGRTGVLAATRFLTVTECATIGAAAALLGISPATLSDQISTLARRAGGPLLRRAQRGSAHSVTALGRRLSTELRAALKET